MNSLTIFFTAALLFIVFDAIVLSLLRSFFDLQVRSVQGSALQLDPYAAMLCYLILIVGLYFFILREQRPLSDAFLLGFFVYSVFEMTNKAILRKWEWKTVVVDSLWGGALFALTTGGVYSAMGKKIHLVPS
jgi:uncharacterized membrane protein